MTKKEIVGVGGVGVYPLGAGGGERIGGVQVSEYSMCMPRRWHGGVVAYCKCWGSQNA